LTAKYYGGDLHSEILILILGKERTYILPLSG
jgi:hypothetical protein